MINAYVRSLLGEWGSTVLDFYLENSLWINGILLLYVLIIVLSRRNYSITLYSLCTSLKTKYNSQVNGKNRKQLEKTLHKIDIPWDDALRSSKFPLITSPRGLLPQYKSTKTLQHIYSNDTLVDTLIELSE
jgi:hypothetical protein